MRGFGLAAKSFVADSFVIVANGKRSIRVVDIFRIVGLKRIVLLRFVPFAYIFLLMIVRIRTSSRSSALRLLPG